MHDFNPSVLKTLTTPASASHKGQNGKLLLIGGSKLFHAASLWPLTVASRIVDMVFYSSISENNEIVKNLKQEFRNGIVVPREHVDDYIKEADCILIGPGLPRPEGEEEGDDDTKVLTESLLKKYPYKKWVIDGGSLQVIDPTILPKASIITPHHKEFEMLFNVPANEENIFKMAQKYHVTIISKADVDIVANENEWVSVKGGNAGMTKGGTGDVLAGLAAALYCTNDAFLAASAASYINKKAGEKLYEKVGYYYNASDLVNEIPSVMKEIIL